MQQETHNYVERVKKQKDENQKDKKQMEEDYNQKMLEMQNYIRALEIKLEASEKKKQVYLETSKGLQELLKLQQKAVGNEEPESNLPPHSTIEPLN